MIVSLVKYILKYYLKTFKYVAPIIFFIIFLFMNYSQAPIIIWHNYSFTALFIFIFSVWVTLGFMDFEEIIQQQLIVLHVQKEYIYYISKILAVWIFIMVLDMFIIIFPIIFNMFNRQIKIEEIIIAILIHSMFALLGISLAVLFETRLLKNRRIALSILSVVVVITITQNNIINEFKQVSFIKWILPPIYFISQRLQDLGDNYLKFSDQTFILFIVHSSIYCFIIIFLYIKLITKKKF